MAGLTRNHIVPLLRNPPIMETTGSTHTVSLHKDKQMKEIRLNPDHQPVQLDLFQMLISDHYSNSVELYQTLPDVFS